MHFYSSICDLFAYSTLVFQKPLSKTSMKINDEKTQNKGVNEGKIKES